MKILATAVASISVVLIEILVAFTFILIPSILYGGSISEVLNFAPFYSFWVAIVTAAIVIFLGIPAYLILRHYDFASARNLLVIGFLIPAILFILFSLIYQVGSGFSSGANYYGTYREMIVSGVRTTGGWISFAEDLVKFGVHGMIGAFVFKKVWERIAGSQIAA